MNNTKGCLEAPPNSHGMKSGFVSLDAGDFVGSHSTKNAEELILFLEGKGQITLPHGQSMTVDAGQAAYIPPHTEHNVVNSGTIPLQYVYVVSPIRD